MLKVVLFLVCRNGRKEQEKTKNNKNDDNRNGSICTDSNTGTISIASSNTT
jgi:hypothetical protein